MRLAERCAFQRFLRSSRMRREAHVRFLGGSPPRGGSLPGGLAIAIASPSRPHLSPDCTRRTSSSAFVFAIRRSGGNRPPGIWPGRPRRSAADQFGSGGNTSTKEVCLPTTMIPLTVACLALLLITLAFVRERHLRVALQALLTRLLQHWRPHAPNQDTAGPGRAGDSDRRL